MIVITVFLGSFLLFGVQPMLGRLLLPGFGGGAAVWSVCLAAYQVLLLAGYLYAHALSRVARNKQWRWHGAALAVAGMWSVLMAWGWKRVYAEIGNSGLPGLEVLGWVALFAGVPYVVLASGSSLLQSWQVRREGRGVYRLYAVSNLGSFLGLFCYRLLVEPRVSLTAQWWGFGAAFCVYGVLVGLTGWRLAKKSVEGISEVTKGTKKTEGTNGNIVEDMILQRVLTRGWWWVALPGLSSFLLVAMTNHLTLDVTPIPLMWVFLLGLFLLSYVVGFSRVGERGLDTWGWLAIMGIGVTAYLTGKTGNSNHIFYPILMGCGLAFCFICIFLHSWLYAARPHGHKALTRFYLGVAAGGAMGGVLGSLVCPMVFTKILEWPVGVLFVNGSLGCFMWRRYSRDHKKAHVAMILLCCISTWLVYNLFTTKIIEGGEVVKSLRNFYGTLSVVRLNTTQEGERPEEYYVFLHGQTQHGAQRKRFWELDAEPTDTEVSRSLAAETWQGFPIVNVARKTYVEEVKPNMYFGPSGGGAGILSRLAREPEKRLRVGVVGLGAGTLAAWGREGDLYRFYEINPQVVDVALDDRYFNFLTGSKADVEVVTGDARKILEAEKKMGFPGWDVLYIDAYNSDSIPLHLATREAFALYRKRLAEGGILVVQMSNWHINLLPLVKSVADETGMRVKGIFGQAHDDFTTSIWAFLTENELTLVCGKQNAFEIKWDEINPMTAPPTDQHGSLVSLIIFYNTKWIIPQKRIW